MARKKVPSQDRAQQLESGSRASEGWLQLRGQYPTTSALEEETIYALPGPLVDQISAVLPSLLTDGEQQFERDLWQASKCGFFRKQPIAYPPLQYPARGGQSVPRRHRQVPKPPLIPIRVRSLKQEKRTVTVEQPFFREEYENSFEQAEAEQWRWAYAGWLVTNPAFRQQCADARVSDPLSPDYDRFPTLSRSVLSRELATPGAIRHLYDVWNLDCLATWELPVPAPLVMTNMPLIHLSHLTQFGVAAFVPWYMLRHRDFDLRRFADRWRTYGSTNLKEWFEPETKHWGPERSIMVLQLYVYLELCLKRRYANKLRNCLAKLDIAFGHYFYEGLSGDETMRKIRLEIQRRVRPAKG